MKKQIKKIKNISSKQLTQIICKGAENKKALDIEVIDTRKQSSICNYMIICTAESTPHFDAIVNGIEELVIKKGVKMPQVQGKKESNWLVIDFISVVVHILGKIERRKYNLEDLWGRSGIVYHF